MTNGNDPAFTFDPNWKDQDAPLTKREYFAAMAMQGLIADDASHQAAANQHRDVFEAIGQLAANAADALIAALNK